MKIPFKHLTHWPTGSRYICNPPVTTTDSDFVALVESLEDSKKELLEESWSTSSSEDYGHVPGQESSHWYSAKKKVDDVLVNFIVLDDEDLFKRWVTATELAKKFNLLKKEDRIALFSVVVSQQQMF